MSRTRVVVGLSGGVDSSVAALLLREQGYEVHAVFMKNWEESFDPGYCSAGEDLADAREVCETLGIPLHTVNFSAEYRDRVFRHFLAEYQAGRTPNPDVLCNREIKFKVFLDHARRLGADRIATGHYARRLEVAGRQHLLKGSDPDKDQSYFLYTLGQAQLARVLFPIGELRKRQVRELARAAGLVNYAKPDSTGICFIGERHFRAFLSQYLPAQPGEIRTLDGTRIGTHQGLMYYTLGQRQGLGIGGRAGSTGEPWYVVDKRLADNVLVVAQGHDPPPLFHHWLTASQLHWVAGAAPPVPFVCQAKTRYRQADQGCILETLEAAGCRVRFVQPQRAMTPGQSVVFYQEGECLGGGVIESAYD